MMVKNNSVVWLKNPMHLSAELEMPYKAQEINLIRDKFTVLSSFQVELVPF